MARKTEDYTAMDSNQSMNGQRNSHFMHSDSICEMVNLTFDLKLLCLTSKLETMHFPWIFFFFANSLFTARLNT